MNSRLIKILFSCSVGLYILLVCFNNIFDYKSNFLFIGMVATMEDTFSKERSGWRSVNSVFWHYVFFILIVLWELSIAFFLWLGSLRMISKFHATAGEFK